MSRLDPHEELIATVMAKAYEQVTKEDPRVLNNAEGHNNPVAHRPHKRSTTRAMLSLVRRKWRNVGQYSRNLMEFMKDDYLPPVHMLGITSQEHIELSHFGEQLVLGPGERLGIGHNFLPVQLSGPTWCDKCGEFIWGLYKQCLQCTSK